jgi:hypothetical protein
MQLEMSTEEAQALQQSLETYVVELEFELVRTDVRELQRALQLRYDRLQNLRGRLERSLAHGAEEAGSGALL